MPMQFASAEPFHADEIAQAPVRLPRRDVPAERGEVAAVERERAVQDLAEAEPQGGYQPRPAVGPDGVVEADEVAADARREQLRHFF